MVVKTGIALPDKVYEELSNIAREMGYGSISKAVRDAVELFIAFNKWWSAKGSVTGTIMVLYPKEASTTERKVIELLGGFSEIIRASIHVPLGEYSLLAILVAGEGSEVKNLYKELTRLDGVLAVQPSLLPLPTGAP
ncbi:hypothetical protein PYJP_17900 [Pyrofollis japonicus]|uniref:CopG family ribbon-helix-helix protein n=1 Tax=Pyrofollis japonicus TaxID=3060460 RepID=UPI00295B6335|nr:ribbon-helix-helix protein, CopG family [Pyrofollis japonicus]BEP18438.1 hypothetical protein PYJP_17900 [Pyrofollis japonicus]